jgi:hypothetical protein
MTRSSLGLACLWVTLVACSSENRPPDGMGDAAVDVAVPDVAVDTGSDVASMDAASMDVASMDAAPIDVASPDVPSPDAASPDAAPADVICASGQTGCAGTCVDTRVDARNCGTCGTACPSGQACMAGRCSPTCEGARVTCAVGTGMACFDLQTDANHCGTCETLCPTGQVCAGGRCGCATGERLCGASCVDTATDNGHCGGCGRACPSGQLCTAGACACPAGAVLCGGACTATDADTANCGACGNRCPSGQFCTRGRCSVTCDAPRTVCGSGASLACADTRTDPARCGGCDTACPARANAATTCASGACGFACDAGHGDCDGNPSNGCEADTRASASNCGACGRACAPPPNAAAACAAGVCGFVCNPGFADCDGNPSNGCEVDTRASVSNCGACGNACPGRSNGAAACAAGACGVTCNAGFADCDGAVATGCEVDVRASASHCGACGRACAAGEACVGGSCGMLCGNGAVDPGELCDTTIAAGRAGACPTACNDGAACTADRLVGGGTCAARCEAPAITTCGGADGCCPAGCTMLGDVDCAPRCGNGAVEAGEACDTAIAPGMPGACPSACSAPMACTSVRLSGGGTCAARCDSTVITTCAASDGCCPTGCDPRSDNDCTSCNVCHAGEVGCSPAGLVRSCTYTGGCWVWNAGTACATGLSCSAGRCAAGSVTISTNTELCGDLYYTGDFIVQGGAVVSCATGDLTIHARTISVDPASSITVAATSTRPSGGSATYVTAGGGYGTAGGAGTHPCYSSNSVSGGPPYGSPYNADVEPGGAGGSGSSPGGGALRLYASASVSLGGRLQATGVRNGSGGGILVASPQVEVLSTGRVAVAGGGGGGPGGTCTYCYPPPNYNYAYTCGTGGAGGFGRVKILYGDRYTNMGMVDAPTPAYVAAALPPTVTSTTHPDPARYYNDEFADFRVAWTTPFPGVMGYWYALSQDANFQLTPAVGTFTTDLAVTFPRSRFTTAGDWYFYIVSVDASARTSTVASRFRMRINTTTPTMTSSSHPVQTTWYPGTTVTATWALPAVTPTNSFSGTVWYRVDQSSSTPPGRAAEGWTLATRPDLLLQRDYTGTLFRNGAYYIHFAAEDTEGNLTRTSSAYRVQFGPEPARTTFFGYVNDAAGARVAGASVRLEPYGLTATTDATGYFIFRDIYALTYAMTVTRGAASLGSATIDATMSPYTFRAP